MRFQPAYLKLHSLVCIVLLLAYMTPSLARAEAKIDKETDPEVLTLEKAIEYAINADTQVAISLLFSENTEYLYQIAKWSYKEFPDDIESFDMEVAKSELKNDREQSVEFSYLQQKRVGGCCCSKNNKLV
ncbi:hypothetical protein BRE01_65590 [Brevibacillus reuszeri]|uniref:Uncharacterized protein n=1 Tax=Brevibacillus reuszeri TaxID=54915 RepID=A0A0K9YVP1_9BACL|nr:hypothetical protein [Brevibacillus reuszeri]KNB72285.1 hypothetical protein ADS79_10315 [Brevibacillus reuszeri]MED1861077.1 hypothetical protein [Brevibacillus reuszeri]GED72857.1 hypothetical protein BRE01_65590 [Brevibacillus reuszeri]